MWESDFWSEILRPGLGEGGARKLAVCSVETRPGPSRTQEGEYSKSFPAAGLFGWLQSPVACVLVLTPRDLYFK